MRQFIFFATEDNIPIHIFVASQKSYFKTVRGPTRMIEDPTSWSTTQLASRVPSATTSTILAEDPQGW